MATPSKATYLVDIDPDTGEYISGWPRIRKSILTILRTRLHTRLMRLWWGSNFLEVQDKPINAETAMNGIMAAIRDINAYEPEFRCISVELQGAGYDGSLTVIVNGVDLIEQQNRRISELL